MNEADWAKVKEHFAAASELEPGAQNDYLKKLFVVDENIYREVLSLLSAAQTNRVLPQSSVNNIFLTQKSGEPHTIAHQAASSDAPTESFETEQPPFEEKMTGQIIGGRYVIGRKLGSGGMGEVFLAEDRNLMNRACVVKMLRAETLGNREVTRKFQQEIEALSRLKDAGIITILDSGTHGRQPFLVLEYVEGEDLSLLISPILFSVGDFLAPTETAGKILRQEDQAGKEIRRRFSAEACRALIENRSNENVVRILRDEFNRLLTDLTLADAGILPPETIQSFTAQTANMAEYNKIPHVNRLILENAFPQQIVNGAKKGLSDAAAAVIFRQLGVSLAHGHEKGIIHRDLKPSNIMVTRTGNGVLQVKLIDFGVAKVQESLVAPTTEIGIAFGTRKYMSPEQINAGSNLTSASDIYSLGLIAFEILTGQNAFPTENFIERCRWQETESIFDFGSLRPDLPAGVGNLITEALAFNPSRRPQNAAHFTEQLADLLNGRKEISAESDRNKTAAAPLSEETVIVKTEKPNLSKQAPPKVEKPKFIGSSKILAGILIFLTLAGIGGWFYWRSVQTTITQNPPDNTPRRELNYRLIVQKYYEGKPFQKPFEATGDEIFGDDWRFKMQISSPQKGSLYLLSENPQTRNLTMLFPHPQKNGGSAAINAGDKIESGEMMFDKTQGLEKFWIVWTENPQAELESVKSYVNPQDLGRIKDAEKENAVREFLTRTADKEKLSEKVSDDKQSKTVYSTADALVKLTELRHN